MGRSTGDFNGGAGKVPTSTGLSIPDSAKDESGILKPIAPSEGSGVSPRRNPEPYLPPTPQQRRNAARSGVTLDTAGAAPRSVSKQPSLANSLKVVEGMTGKKTVGMNDTIRIVDHLGAQLLQAHLSLSKNGQHAKHDEVAAGLRAASSSIAFAKQKKDTETPLAWQHIDAAGKAIHSAFKDLSSVDSHAVADIHSPHSINGVETRFTPGRELLQITRQPSKFREQGRPVKNVGFGDRVVEIPKGARARIAANQQEANANIRGGAQPLRRDVIKAFDEKTAPATRVRRAERTGPDTRSGAASPLSLGPVVEPTGIAAVQPHKVGDWSGTEQTPKTGVPAESKTQQRVAKKRVQRAARRATKRANKAGEI